MGMALRGRRSEREEGWEKEREEARPPSPFISLIPEIRFWVSILPEIKGSLFHSDRQRRVTASHFLEEHLFLFFWTCLYLSVCLFCLCWLCLLFSPFGWNITPPASDGSFDSSLLCNTSAGKLHLCKCHTEWKDPAGREPRAFLGHASSRALGSRCLDEVPKAFWWG